ncbi:MAG: VanZ family protein [Thermodesulfobacteriota bacterium]|nr:VanZ family protein [Thermodesulfobacteriota bacterium]
MCRQTEIALWGLFGVMITLTAIGGLKIEPYETAGPDLLTGEWAFYAGDAGEAEKRGADLYLFSPAGEGVSIRQDLDALPPGQVVRLSGDMRCKGVKAGEMPWNHARVVLIQRDGEGARLERPHVAASFTGTVAWQHYEKHFTIGPDVASLSVIAQLSRCSGKFWVRNLRLHPMAQAAVYTRAKRWIFAGWGVFAVCLLGSVLYRSPGKVAFRVLLAGIFVAIVAGTVIPADMKHLLAEKAEAWVLAANAVMGGLVAGKIARVGHFVFFFVFGVMLALAVRHRDRMPAMVYLFMVAGGSEMIQIFIEGRSPFVMDFMTDLAGGAAGVVLVVLWQRISRGSEARPDVQQKAHE